MIYFIFEPQNYLTIIFELINLNFSNDHSRIYHNRGLIFPWKQIIYFNFDITMSQKLLFSIIRLCELSNANVRGMGGQTTRGSKHKVGKMSGGPKKYGWQNVLRLQT